MGGAPRTRPVPAFPARSRAVPSAGSPPFRARAGGRSWARSIVERRGEARGSRAEARLPVLSPPGRRGCICRAPQPGCGERLGLAGSAAAPGTCALAQTSRDHEPDRPRILLHAQLLCKCRPRLWGPRGPSACCTRSPAQGRLLRFRISAHPPSQGPWKGRGELSLFFLGLALIFGGLWKAGDGNSVTHLDPAATALDCRSPGPALQGYIPLPPLHVGPTRCILAWECEMWLVGRLGC